MELLQVEESGISNFFGLGKKAKAKKEEKQEIKKEKKATKLKNKQDKKAMKVDKKAAKNEKKRAAAEAKKIRANAKQTRADAKMVKEGAKQTLAENGESPEPSEGQNFLNTAMNGIGAILGRKKDSTEDYEIEGGSYASTDEVKPFYKQTWFFVAAPVTLLLIAVGSFFIFKKKK